ncbi:TPA: recombinase family protein [Aeromonas hydrophila]
MTMTTRTLTRIFAYCRVSTTEQTTENQLLALHTAGLDIRPDRVVSETISGATPAMQRPEFTRLLDRLEAGDTLAVLKLDRLGRDSIDVQQTIESLTQRGIRVRCLDIPVDDLSSSQGKLMLQLMAAFAEFERGRIRERTVEGQARARAEGKAIGRPVATDTRREVQKRLQQGMSWSEVAADMGISVRTVARHSKQEGITETHK